MDTDHLKEALQWVMLALAAALALLTFCPF